MAQGISFGHFNIVGGSVHEDGPYVGVVEDRTPAEALADLYLTLEPAAPAGAAQCAELLGVIEEQFGRPQYSVTGNLLQALRAAQQHLWRSNKSAPPDRQAAVGATCLAVSEDQAYLAQAGPGLAYMRHDGLLRRYEAVEPDARAPLGTKIACSPEFNHFELSQGDTVLLVSSHFAEIVDEQNVDQLLSLPAAEALPEIYRLVRHEFEFSALYLAVSGSLRRQGPAYTAEDQPLARAYPGGHGAARGAWTEMAECVPADRPSRPTAGRAAAPAAPHVESSWLTKRRDLERLTEHRSINLPRPASYTVAVAVALTLVGWFGVPHLLQTGRQDRFSYLVADLRQSETSAGAAPGVAQKRALLNRAQADLVEARTLRPADPQLATLGAQLTSEVQSLDQVHQLAGTQELIDLANTTIAAQSVNEIVSAGRIYVLDANSGKIFAFDPHASPPSDTPVFQPGMEVESIRTGLAAHIAVAPPAGGHLGLVYVLDSNRRLFALDDSGTLRTVGVAKADMWKSARAIADDGRNLYVLDGAGNQIWRFDGSDAGFTSPPTPLVAKADLTDAVQLSVAGHVYVGTANGKLQMVSNGRLEPARVAGLDHPLMSPQPPVVDPASSMLLVADTANDRIVVSSADGTYQYQYVGAALQGLRVIAVDQTSGLLYALCGARIISNPLH